MDILRKHLQDVSRSPRYTSYPTAPHFSDAVSSDTVKTWLGRIGTQSDTLSLYIHIPFCEKLCLFCGCHMKVVNTYNPVEQYLHILEQEVAIIAQAIHKNKNGCPPVTHIHFGGGSPTALAPKDFKRFMDVLKSHFPITDTTDIAVEIDPRTVDEAKMDAYTQSGMNRISLGVQDFNPTVQKAINREQPFELVKNILHTLQSKGMRSINMDIMYGLPFQTCDTIQETIHHVLTLSPNRLSIFGYAHVPWMKPHQKLIPEEALAGLEERLHMFEIIKSTLESGGYTAIGLDHFAKNTDPMVAALHTKTLHRNFQGYTTDKADALVGMGHTAIGYTPDGYMQNTSDPTLYKNTIHKGDLPIQRGYTLQPNDIVRRNIINTIMCYMHVDLEPFGGIDAFAPEMETLSPLIADGAIRVEGNTLILHDTYRALLRIFARAFDVYHTQSTAKHSLSV